jgi:hypothetical protein
MFLAFGTVFVVLFLANRYLFARPPFTTRAAATAPLARRMNVVVGVGGVVLIVLGLLFPSI